MTTVDFRPTGEQRAIIDHAPAPLRVAAGAGTGKTTTIVHRLAASVPTCEFGIATTVGIIGHRGCRRMDHRSVSRQFGS